MHAQTPFHHRDPGLLGLLGSNHCPHFSMIVDGIHTHKHTARIVQRTQPHRVVLVTDAISAMGLPPGTTSTSAPLLSQTVRAFADTLPHALCHWTAQVMLS